MKQYTITWDDDIMNKDYIMRILRCLQRDTQEINLLWSTIHEWEVEDFLLNSELVTNYIHDIIDKITMLENKYTLDDEKYIKLVTLIEENIEEGKLYTLRHNINELLSYLEEKE